MELLMQSFLTQLITDTFKNNLLYIININITCMSGHQLCCLFRSTQNIQNEINAFLFFTFLIPHSSGSSCSTLVTDNLFSIFVPDIYKMLHVERECCAGVKKEPLEPLMIGHRLLMWNCRDCLCFSVLHSGTCGFSYRMFYCSTMFLPWSSGHCIKTTLSRDAHTGRVGIIVRAHTLTQAHKQAHRLMMTSARPMSLCW